MVYNFNFGHLLLSCIYQGTMYNRAWIHSWFSFSLLILMLFILYKFIFVINI